MTRIKATGPVTVAEYMREGLTSPTEVRLGHCYRVYEGRSDKSYRGKAWSLLQIVCWGVSQVF